MYIRVALAFSCFGFLCRAQVSDVPTRTATLEYTLRTADESCPDEPRLRRSVSELLGYDPFREHADTHVSAEIKSANAEFVAHIELRSAGEVTGERELAASDCKELGSAAALAIALAIDPMLPSRQRAREHAPKDPPKPRTLAPRSRARARLSRPERPPLPETVEPWRLRLGVEALGSFGSAPAPAIGAAAVVGARRGVISLGLEVRRDVPAGKDVEPNGHVRASLSVVSFVPCYHRGVFDACLLGTIGALQGEGTEVSEPRKATSLHAAAGARVGLEIPLTSATRIAPFGDLRAPVTRTTLTVNGQEAWTTPALIPSLGCGFLGEFPL